MKKKMIAGFSGAGSTYYYSQIDNSKVERVESKGGVINFSGSMDY